MQTPHLSDVARHNLAIPLFSASPLRLHKQTSHIELEIEY